MAQSSPSMTSQLPRVDSPPLYDHAVSPAPGSEMMAAVFEMLRSQERDRERHERWMRDHERERELDHERWMRERERQLDHERWMRDRERDRERHHLRIETHRENSAGLQQLRRDMANNPRFSRRGTPTGTPVPAVDDRPKPAPRKTPTKADPTAPYQAAARHPGSAEPTTCQCTQNPRVPALPLLIPQPPTQPPGVASMIATIRARFFCFLHTVS